MVVAKLSRAGFDDWFFSLDPGEYRLGSDFGCEIALIHPAVVPEHLTLKVMEGRVSILPKPGVVVMLFRHALQRATTLTPEEWTSWRPGDRLIIADISMEIEGIDQQEEPQQPQAEQAVHERPLPRILAAASVLLLLTILNLSFPTWPERMAAAHAEPRGGASAADLPADRGMIRQALSESGARLEELTRSNGRWRAVLRVSDAAARDAVRAKLAEMGLPLSADIHVDEEITEAAALIVANLGAKARVLGYEDGVVTLSAVDDFALSEKLVETLKSDVPGIGEVRFQRASPVEAGELTDRITGVWHGAYPYVVLDDGTIVRPGEALWKDTKLIEIARRYLLIEVAGKEKKVFVR